MNTNKALYWIALTAVALGFGSEYQRGGFSGLHNVAQSTETRFCRVAGHAEHALLALGILPSHARPAFTQEALAEQADQMQRVVALRQAELDRAMALRDAELARTQARLARAQAIMAHTSLGNLRVVDSPHFKMINDGNHRVITICSKNGRKVHIEAGPDAADFDMDVPEVQIGEQF